MLNMKTNVYYWLCVAELFLRSEALQANVVEKRTRAQSSLYISFLKIVPFMR